MINIIVKNYHIAGYFEGKIFVNWSIPTFQGENKFHKLSRAVVWINIYSKYSRVKFS